RARSPRPLAGRAGGGRARARRSSAAPVPDAALDLRARALPPPALPARGLGERARPRHRRLRACRQSRLGLGSLPARPALGTRRARRLGRRILPVLRGQGSLPPRPRLRLRRALRARRAGAPYGRCLGAAPVARTRPRAEPRPVRPKASWARR